MESDDIPAGAPVPVARSVIGASSVGLGIAMAVANLLGYVLVLVLSRYLGPADFGAFSAVNTVGGILAIPVGALQVVIARHQQAHDGETGVRLAVVLGLVGLAVGLCLAPVGQRVLHLTSPWPIILVGAVLLPMLLSAAAQGILLGSRRFGLLAGLFLATALIRLAAAGVSAALDLSVTGVFVALVLAAVVMAGVSLLIVRRQLVQRRRRPERHLLAEVWRTNRTLAALTALTTIDIIPARHFLPADEAGHYAMASLFAKVVFWGTQFVALALVPAVQGPGARRRVLEAVGVVTALGVALTGVVVVLHDRLLQVTGGDAYEGAAELFIPFTVVGTAWAMAQVLLFADMARDRARLGLLTWVVVIVEVVAMTIWHNSGWQLVGIAGVCAAAVVALGLVRLLAPRRQAVGSS